MKAIIKTPTDIKFTVLVGLQRDEKIEDMHFYKALTTANKHLFVEYDENNNNLITQCVDLDALGMSYIKTVEEFEKIFGKYHAYTK